MSDRTIREILKLSPEERKSLYQVSNTPNKHIDRVVIDNNVFNDYSAFSFLMEKTFIKSPSRASDGSIPDLDTYAWFLTPHLKIDFSLLSIDSYRTLMQMIRSKNEFLVTCYDIVEDKDVTHKMYFATEQMPKLWSITRALNNNDSWVELVGVQDYTVELIGTNTNFDEVKITYYLNKPSDATWNGETTVTYSSASNLTHSINASLDSGEKNEQGQSIYKNVIGITFGDKYRFKYWTPQSNGEGFRYINGNEYRFSTSIDLYAIWEAGA